MVVFVGDGPSDRYAMHHADLVFATGQLLAWCRAHGYPATPWTELTEVADALAGAARVGRRCRPAAGGGAALASGPRPIPGRPPFICGPEVWGPGRTVPPHPPAG